MRVELDIVAKCVVSVIDIVKQKLFLEFSGDVDVLKLAARESTVESLNSVICRLFLEMLEAQNRHVRSCRLLSCLPLESGLEVFPGLTWFTNDVKQGRYEVVGD